MFLMHSLREALTLQPLSLVALDHDAELQHQLRGAF